MWLAEGEGGGIDLYLGRYTNRSMGLSMKFVGKCNNEECPFEMVTHTILKISKHKSEKKQQFDKFKKITPRAPNVEAL